jgi:serine/threonine protein kinase
MIDFRLYVKKFNHLSSAKVFMDLVEYNFRDWFKLAIEHKFISKVNGAKFLTCFAVQLIKIVSTMHEKLIVHRDINDVNIYVSKGKIRLGVLRWWKLFVIFS